MNWALVFAVVFLALTEAGLKSRIKKADKAIGSVQTKEGYLPARGEVQAVARDVSHKVASATREFNNATAALAAATEAKRDISKSSAEWSAAWLEKRNAKKRVKKAKKVLKKARSFNDAITRTNQKSARIAKGLGVSLKDRQRRPDGFRNCGTAKTDADAEDARLDRASRFVDGLGTIISVAGDEVVSTGFTVYKTMVPTGVDCLVTQNDDLFDSAIDAFKERLYEVQSDPSLQVSSDPEQHAAQDSEIKVVGQNLFRQMGTTGVGRSLDRDQREANKRRLEGTESLFQYAGRRLWEFASSLCAGRCLSTSYELTVGGVTYSTETLTDEMVALLDDENAMAVFVEQMCLELDIDCTDWTLTLVE